MTFPSRSTSRGATALAVIASAVAYPFLPRRVPTHFDLEGQADRCGSRASAALTLPLTMIGIQAVNERLGAWPGGDDREDGRSGAVAREQAVGLIELALLPAHLALLANGLGKRIDMGRTQRFVAGALMLALGNVLPKLPRNGLIGIRTPWTLADPTVWERTHRVGGYLLMAAGALNLASLPLNSKRTGRMPVIAILTAVALSAGYSFFAYRRRPRTV